MWFLFASTTFGIVPADLQSAGIEYQKVSADNFLIRLLPISCSKTLTLTNVELRFQRS